MSQDKRRPIKERATGWARGLASLVARTGLTPNQISVLSVLISGAGAAVVWDHQGRPLCFFLAALAITLRLICNMIDGMVAVEHNRRSPSGEIYNELPDRLSDSLSLLGVAYACGWVQLGLWCSLLAVLTAYVRTLATAAGAPADFSGPMAKQQRMKTLIGACLACAYRPQWMGWVLPLALSLIALGSAWTCWRRTRRAIAHLESGS
jgi:CDP-diacylglycerol--glycerol-3-phosphate 3-phosphatidyltransferase